MGTRFIVQYTHDKVQVSVLENAVEISSNNQAPVTLNSRYRLEYRRQGLVVAPKAFSKSEPNAWRIGNIKFNARPLKEVIAEIDRYLPAYLKSNRKPCAPRSTHSANKAGYSFFTRPSWSTDLARPE